MQLVLTVPTVVDRMLQQMIAQVLMLLWDHTFSTFSYGFRPGRSQHMAVEQARRYVQAGYTYVVSIDLAKFLDRASYYTSSDEVVSKRSGWASNTLMSSPLRLPRRT